VPDWADRFRKKAAGAGSTTGKWRTSDVEIARGPMLAVTEPGVATVTVMVCTQLMKTALIENTFGFFAHLDPSPMLMLQPKEDAAEQFSKERITPLIRATPVLRRLVGTRKTRNPDETIRYKSFPGGFLAIEGAGSPDNVARRPIKRVFCDEIDKYVVTREGDAVGLAEERMGTFVGAQSIRACSPTIEGESAIETSYLDGDQRKASVACPHCSHRQFLEFFAHIEWDKELDEHGKVTAHLPKTAKVHCEACGCTWSEAERLQALQTARWHQTKAFRCCGAYQDPLEVYAGTWRTSVGAEAADAVASVWDWWVGPRHAVYRARCSQCGAWPVDNEHASFTAGKEFSPWERDSPPKIAKKWLDWKDTPDARVKFDNTQRGKPHRRAAGAELNADTLASRREVYPAEVPDGVAVITAGIDTQNDRLEIEVVGWGRDEESWSLAYEVFPGDPNDPGVWKRLDDYLKMLWVRADGRTFEVMAACIDTGGGRTEAVYQFAKERIGRRIWGIRGDPETAGQRKPVWPAKMPLTRTRRSYQPFTIGVNAAKDNIRQRLLAKVPGPGYLHFPADRDVAYFAQLTAEKLVPDKRSKRLIWICPSGLRNEALDCRVYAYAALAGLTHFGLKLNRRADEVGAVATPVVMADGSPAAIAPIAVTGEPPVNVIKVGKPAAAKKKSMGAMLARRRQP
jgi:phage terminase large subunit GpA-like protein